MDTHHSRSLAARSRGRDNNLTLLRLAAALAVLISHTFFLVLGPDKEPMGSRLGETPGTIAVEVFFVISGFLVTGSLLTRGSAIAFVPARLLRIFPGLAFEAIFAALVLGALLSPLPASAYYSSPQPLAYVLKTIALQVPAGALPGANLDNASLWSLPLEVALYGMLLFAWLARNAILGEAAGQLAAWAKAVAFAALFAGATFWFTRRGGFKLAMMFGSGVAFQLLRDRIRLSRRLAALALAALAIAALNALAFRLALVCLLPYLVLCAAYLPRGRILKFNMLGDYSYGLYIYAFPVQLAAVHYLPHASVWTVVALSTVAAGAMAALSWHLVEKRALKALPSAIRLLQNLKSWPARQPAQPL